MKTRLALILVLVTAAAVAFLVFKFATPKPTPRPPLPAPQPPPGPATPREAVAAYLEALYEGDLSTAYQHLSTRSREAHPYRQFVQLCREGPGPDLDLDAAQEHPVEEDHARVTVPMLEDVAEATFNTVLEDGAWRVVFIEGKPGFPYP